MPGLKKASLILALAFWILPLHATPCPPQIAELGTVTDGFRTGWFRGSYASGPVTRSGWGLVGRDYSIHATLVKLDPAGRLLFKDTGTIERFVLTQTVPLVSATTLIGFGALKAALLPQIFGSNAWTLAQDYFAWLVQSNPAIFTAGGALTVAGWNTMLAKPYFQSDVPRAADEISRTALDLTPEHLEALNTTLSSRRPQVIKQNGIDYAPYHLVVYMNEMGAVTRMTLLAVPADTKNGTEIIEIELETI